MLFHRTKPTTILLIVFTCITSYHHAVTEAEGSSGSTWAKALPPAHAAPSESECQPYIEKAIKKLADTSKDETVEAEKDTDDIECVSNVPLSVPEVSNEDDEDNINEIKQYIGSSNEDQNDSVNSSEKVNEPSQSSLEEVEKTDRNDSLEEVDTGGKEVVGSEEENPNENGEKSEIKSEASDEARTDEKVETDDEQIEITEADDVKEEEEEDDDQNVSTAKTTGGSSTTIDDNEIKSEDQAINKDKTEGDSKKKDERTITTKAPPKENEKTDEKVADEDKYKRNVNSKKNAPKKRKISIAKLIKDKIMKKFLKQEVPEEEDADDDGKQDNKKTVEESKEAEIKKDLADDNTETSSKEETKQDESDETNEITRHESNDTEIVGNESNDTEIVGNESNVTDSSESDDREVDDDAAEEELTMNQEIPTKLRSRKHITEILQLEHDENSKKEKVNKLVDTTLKELKKLYETAIKPLEVLYKYRDLSNRHFGDAEIFSKPLILFMGPWSGGKSSIINYLLENEFKETSLRTGAEPSPAYFNILMWGENETVLEGTQLAADWTFSGLQKFGQGLLDRLRGLQIPNDLLQKVNIVEIPGILEIRKQVERVFPFNDACQWFIDRADVIFLVYDPAKLDVGPETEAILDQLKGREYQTRIILNKADQIKAEELMRIQATLIWNISPLMSSIEPPIMYTTSLWSMPYELGAPTKLLHSQEIAFLKDLRSTIKKRVENKIASARRFAVRVRNHAKMVDCYLTTYYNHKSFFGNRKKINDDIVEHPQNYHIYEGLSTLTNISRYDLPDPDVYRDFFKLHPIYEFQRLSETCTYFRGCPINRLDIAIAYDLPELVGKYKKPIEQSPFDEQSPKNETIKTNSKTKK